MACKVIHNRQKKRLFSHACGSTLEEVTPQTSRSKGLYISLIKGVGEFKASKDRRF